MALFCAPVLPCSRAPVLPCQEVRCVEPAPCPDTGVLENHSVYAKRLRRSNTPDPVKPLGVDGHFRWRPDAIMNRF